MSAELELDLDPTELMTAEEVARRLRLRSTWWLEEGAREGRLPCTMLGRSRRYSRDNVLKIIEICNEPATARAPKSNGKK